ncbi:MAG TPA: uroporphyrinogen-III synthase [Paludibacteraceae bacterium]|nr:uroporphyrinogen-III synthase [Paludibacteraceae bacterium]
MKIKKVLVSQPKPENGKSPYFEIAEKYNVKIDFRPFIKVDPILAKEFRLQKINIADYTAIVFTSRHGIDHFFRLTQEMRINVSEDLKYFCISETVAFYLQKYIQFRKRKVFNSTTGKLPELFQVIAKHLDENFLVVMSDNHNAEISGYLNQYKVKHDIGLMYRTVSNDFTSDEEFNYDMLLFFSPQGVASLLKNFPNFDQKETHIGCFGANTTQAVRDANLRLDLEVPTKEFTSMAMALESYIKENHKNDKK